MPFSYAQYTGNGSSQTFSVPFPYLLRAHVKLYYGLNLVTGGYSSLLAEGTNYTWTTGATVLISTPPPSGTVLTIRRETPTTSRLVAWVDGSALTAQDLDTADLQNFYAIQEHKDYVESLSLTPSANVIDNSITESKLSTDAVTAIKIKDQSVTSGKLALYTQPGTGAVARSLYGRMADWCSVKDFGAVGDGIADDTAAIQAAVSSGRAAFVPAGVYKITATINLINGYKALIGDASMPILNKTTPGPAIAMTCTAGVVTNEYSSIGNLWIKQASGGAPSWPTLISASDAAVVIDGSNSSNAGAALVCSAYNLRIMDFAVGLYLNNTTKCRLEKIWVHMSQYWPVSIYGPSNRFVGVYLNSTPKTYRGLSANASIEIVDVNVDGRGAPESGGAHVITSVGFFVYGKDVRDVFFDRCETAYTRLGFYIESTSNLEPGGADYNWDIQIRRPICDSYFDHGIRLFNLAGPGSITINGGYFVSAPVGSPGPCIYATNVNGLNVGGGVQLLGLVNNGASDVGVQLDSCNCCSVVGNNLLNLRQGIRLNGSSNCTVTANHIYAAYTDSEKTPTLEVGISVYGGSEENAIVGNTIRGYSATYKYTVGINILSGSPRNVVAGNSMDTATVTTPYSIQDAATTALTDGGLQTPGRLQLRGGSATDPIQFIDALGNVVATLSETGIMTFSSASGAGIYNNAGRAIVQGNDSTFPILFRNGAGTVIGKISAAGVYSAGAP